MNDVLLLMFTVKFAVFRFIEIFNYLFKLLDFFSFMQKLLHHRRLCLHTFWSKVDNLLHLYRLLGILKLNDRDFKKETFFFSFENTFSSTSSNPKANNSCYDPLKFVFVIVHKRTSTVSIATIFGLKKKNFEIVWQFFQLWF